MNLLYSSSYFKSYQCDKGRCFFIDFGHKQVQLSFCQLLSLRQKVLSIDITTHFDRESNYNGIELLSLCNREHLFILDTYQVLDLKELIKATFVMMEINSMVSC